MKHFYHHLVSVEKVHVEIDELTIEDHEKKQLKNLVERNVHFTVLDTVLSELSEEDKKEFFKHAMSSSHEATWSFLRTKTENIEGKITKAADNLLKEFSKDIASVHKS